MSNTFTVTGNLTADPELRATGKGIMVASFTIADTPRKLNKVTNEWEDGDTFFVRCNLWRDAGENVAESLRKGQRVVASGELVQRNWETKEGEKRVSIELNVDEIGPSLKYATASVTKRAKGSGAPKQQSSDDPWGSGFAGSNDDPPF